MSKNKRREQVKRQSKEDAKQLAVAGMTPREKLIYRLGYREGKREGAILERERLGVDILARAGITVLMYEEGGDTYWT